MKCSVTEVVLCALLCLLASSETGSVLVVADPQTVKDERFISVQNASDQTGLELLVYTKTDPNHKRYFIAGHYLSPLCSRSFHVCTELFVISHTLPNNISQYIVVVPLVKEVGFFEFQYNGSQFWKHKHHLVEVNYSPAAVLEILDCLYVICVDPWSYTHTVHKIVVDENTLENTFASSRMDNRLLPFYPYALSSFTKLGDDYGSQLICFAVGNSLYGFNPVSRVFHGQIGTLGNCTSAESFYYQTTNLSPYAVEHTLVAYCSDSASYFDLDYWYLRRQQFYSESGHPYYCTDPDIQLTAYPQHISYGTENDREDAAVPGTFDLGLCFGTSYFAFINKEGGVYILNISSGYRYDLSVRACQSENCKPLLTFGDYLVVREDNGSVTVVDISANYSTIIKAPFGLDHSLVTLIFNLEKDMQSSPSPPSGEQNSHAASGATTWIIVGVAGTVSAFILTIVLVVFTYVYRWYKRTRCEEYNPLQNDYEMGSQDDQADQIEGTHDSPVNSRSQGGGESEVGLQVDTTATDENHANEERSAPIGDSLHSSPVLVHRAGSVSHSEPNSHSHEDPETSSEIPPDNAVSTESSNHLDEGNPQRDPGDGGSIDNFDGAIMQPQPTAQDHNNSSEMVAGNTSPLYQESTPQTLHQAFGDPLPARPYDIHIPPASITGNPMHSTIVEGIYPSESSVGTSIVPVPASSGGPTSFAHGKDKPMTPTVFHEDDR